MSADPLAMERRRSTPLRFPQTGTRAAITRLSILMPAHNEAATIEEAVLHNPAVIAWREARDAFGLERRDPRGDEIAHALAAYGAGETENAD